MYRITLCCLLMLCSLKPMAQSTDLPLYLTTYKEIAIQEMNRSGIPASIIMAQAIVESAWGKATLAQAANNHFGIKCKSDWMGDAYLLQDDDYNAEGELIESCFRVYPDVLSSYRDHSNFLIDNPRYAALFELDPADYAGWAHGLKACGYATDPLYAEKLIKKIEDYQLHDMDQQEVVMSAPSFEIPYTESSAETTAPQSMMLPDDFGLIAQPVAVTPIESPAVVEKPTAILESPTYEIASTKKD